MAGTAPRLPGTATRRRIGPAEKQVGRVGSWVRARPDHTAADELRYVLLRELARDLDGCESEHTRQMIAARMRDLLGDLAGTAAVGPADAADAEWRALLAENLTGVEHPPPT